MDAWKRHSEVTPESFPEYSVVIPVYNEEDSLKILHQRIAVFFSARAETYEILYINDASTDNSLEVLKSLEKEFINTRAYSLAKHAGQSAALCAGFLRARGIWVITLDADLQNPPEEIGKLLDFSKQFDCVTGIRQKREDSFTRILSSRIAYFFRRIILNDSIKDVGCSLRCFRRECILSFPFFANFHRFFPYVLRRMGYSVHQVPVLHQPRKFGYSKYSVANRLGKGIFDLVGIFWLSRRIMRIEFARNDEN